MYSQELDTSTLGFLYKDFHLKSQDFDAKKWWKTFHRRGTVKEGTRVLHFEENPIYFYLENSNTHTLQFSKSPKLTLSYLLALISNY